MPMRSALLALLLALSVGAPAAAAEPRWRRVPTDADTLNNKQDALAFGSPTVGLYGNGTGRIYRTEDAGAHRRLVWHHPGTYVRALDMADAVRGMILDIHSVDARTGFIAGASASDGGIAHARILKATDGGETWRPAHMGLSTNWIRVLPLPDVGTRVIAIGHGMAGMVDAVKEKLLPSERTTALDQAIKAVRGCGVVSVPGVYGGPVSVDMGQVVQKGLTLRSGQTHVKRYLEPLTRLIQDGKIDTTSLISHRSTDLEEGPGLYKTFKDKADGCTKVVFKLA